MHKAKRAIIMAAGKGERLKPVTLSTPKPMVKVNGTRMIDTIINALHKNEIYEIYVVVGHLKEKFNELLKDYPDLRIIENPYYDTCNNISSLYMCKDYLEDVIIADGDQIIYNTDILKADFERSGYNCTWSEGYTKEWLLTANKNNIVEKCSRTGGSNGWKLYSISRWNKEDGRKLKKYLEEEFIINKNTQIYWDDVALFCHPKEFRLGIYKMNEEDVIEIDNFEELVSIDKSYL